MSSTDRIGRVLFAVLVLLLYIMDIISGGLATTLIVVGVIFVATSAIGFCPMYTLFGMNTNKGNS
jgi:type IV secretory pathway VirB2 component (pilin)